MFFVVKYILVFLGKLYVFVCFQTARSRSALASSPTLTPTWEPTPPTPSLLSVMIEKKSYFSIFFKFRIYFQVCVWSTLRSPAKLRNWQNKKIAKNSYRVRYVRRGKTSFCETEPLNVEANSKKF